MICPTRRDSALAKLTDGEIDELLHDWADIAACLCDVRFTAESGNLGGWNVRYSVEGGRP